MIAWRRVMVYNNEITGLSTLKENGVNRIVRRRGRGLEYAMDETAVYNTFFDEESRLIIQGARVMGNFRQRRDLNMALKMVYRVQSDEENWNRYSDILHCYHLVQAKSLYSALQCIEENLHIEPLIAYESYKLLALIDCGTFKEFYSDLEWNTVDYRLTTVYLYYQKFEEIISRAQWSKYTF